MSSVYILCPVKGSRSPSKSGVEAEILVLPGAGLLASEVMF